MPSKPQISEPTADQLEDRKLRSEKWTPLIKTQGCLEFHRYKTGLLQIFYVTDDDKEDIYRGDIPPNMTELILLGFDLGNKIGNRIACFDSKEFLSILASDMLGVDNGEDEYVGFDHQGPNELAYEKDEEASGPPAYIESRNVKS